MGEIRFEIERYSIHLNSEARSLGSKYPNIKQIYHELFCKANI